MTEAKISFLLLHPLGKSVVGDTADFPPLTDYIEAFEKFEDRIDTKDKNQLHREEICQI